MALPKDTTNDVLRRSERLKKPRVMYSPPDFRSGPSIPQAQLMGNVKEVDETNARNISQDSVSVVHSVRSTSMGHKAKLGYADSISSSWQSRRYQRETVLKEAEAADQRLKQETFLLEQRAQLEMKMQRLKLEEEKLDLELKVKQIQIQQDAAAAKESLVKKLSGDLAEWEMGSSSSEFMTVDDEPLELGTVQYVPNYVDSWVQTINANVPSVAEVSNCQNKLDWQNRTRENHQMQQSEQRKRREAEQRRDAEFRQEEKIYWEQGTRKEHDYRDQKRHLEEERIRKPVVVVSSHEPLSSVVAARKTYGRELLKFDGNYADWPIFIKNFNDSTRLCQFSDLENICRLQKGLIGAAKEAVSSLLISPDNMSEIIETLELQFGRPDLIIRDLIQKAKREPVIKDGDFKSLIRFATVVKNLKALIQSYGHDSYLQNPILVTELLEKLPYDLQLQWGMKTAEEKSSTVVEFSNWITLVAQGACKVVRHPMVVAAKQDHKPEVRKFMHPARVNIHKEKREENCTECDDKTHQIENCAKFIKRKHNDRWEWVKNKKLCFGCLNKNCNLSRCEKRKKCGIEDCEKYHHRLLHKSVDAAQLNCHASVTGDRVLFRIVPVHLYNQGTTTKTYAFLDEGSSVTLIEEKLADEMGVYGSPKQLILKWTGDTVKHENGSRMVGLQISGLNPGHKKFEIEARTVRHMGLPRQSMDIEALAKLYRYLIGVPAESYKNVVPRLLIGLNNHRLMTPLKVREGRQKTGPAAIKTRLGWVIYGQEGRPTDSNASFSLHIDDCYEDQLHRIVRESFTTENFGVKPPTVKLESISDQRAINILKETTVKVNGRYETGLLWKVDNIKLPDSYDMALRRMYAVENRIRKDSALQGKVNQIIRDNMEKGYCRKLSRSEAEQKTPKTWYLPIFPVTNPAKPNKIRIVYDAAAKVANVSLNDMLLTGPDLVAPLIGVLMKFREFPIGVCGDIKEMFHQVKIRHEDQQSQRFLWRNCEAEKKPDEYVLEVMTFGATCSPSSAQYVKNLNAEGYRDTWPDAVDSIVHKHYVDDYLDSFPTVEEAVRRVTQVSEIHQHGGFEIRNWISNSDAVVRTLTGKEQINQSVNLDLENELKTDKVLGMYWCTVTDEFKFKLSFHKIKEEVLQARRRPTKREILSIVMSIYDPLGMLAYYLVHAKLLLQEIWKEGTAWDNPVSETTYAKWCHWWTNLQHVERLKVARCYSSRLSQAEAIELHIFVDASEFAFAAVAYIRLKLKKDEVILVAAKTRVAPRKMLSIPRLELQAAVLGTRLAKMVEEQHSIQFNRRVFWSDSKTVLNWLLLEQRNFKSFVAHRIGEILDSTSQSDWRWVPTKENVADEATKWTRDVIKDENDRWFHGPDFLHQDDSAWPLTPAVNSLNTSGCEELKPVHMHVKATNPYEVVDINRFSKWSKLLGTMMAVLKFINKLRIKIGKQEKWNQLEVFNVAQAFLFKKAQWEIYTDEVLMLERENKLPRNSSIKDLSPYLDEEGVLRMKGRIDAAHWASQDSKRPIILPKQHKISILLILHYHCRYRHLFNETVVNELRQSFWIPDLRVTLKKVKKLCQVCQLDAAKVQIPEMAPLPEERITPYVTPFTYTGVDYFGPMTVTVGRRREKRWGVIYTCLTMRAVYLVLTNSLSTDACILAFRNFICRRGCPKKVFSDNGTNFQGMVRELTENIQVIEHETIQRVLENDGYVFEWQFIVPGAPHWGGAWERLVRSVKLVLAKLLHEQAPSHFVLESFLIEAENIINSRPLTYMPLSDGNEEALTPNHFILGSSSGVRSPGVFTESDKLSPKHWRRTQQLIDSFWKRWIREYLPMLTKRTKWFDSQEPVKIGDLVIIIDENAPRNVWRRGRISQIFPGKDGHVRAAEVMTEKSILRRPVTKLAILKVEPNLW